MTGFDPSEPPPVNEEADTIAEPEAEVAPAHPQPREPVGVLILGLVLFLGLLAFRWYQAQTVTPSAAASFQEATLAPRIYTQLVQTLCYWRQHGDIPPQFIAVAQIGKTAAQAAQIWERTAAKRQLYAARYHKSPAADDDIMAVNAAILYGAAGQFTHARAALSRAELTSLNRASIRELHPLFADAPTPLQFSPGARQFLTRVTAAPLLYARNAQLQGNSAEALAVLAVDAQTGARLVVVAVILSLGILALITASFIAWVVMAVKNPRLPPSTLPSPPWGIGLALIALSAHHLLALALLFLFQGPFVLLHFHLDVTTNLLLQFPAIALSAVIVAYILALSCDVIPHWAVFGWRKVGKSLGYGCLALLLVYPLVWAAILISQHLFPGEPEMHPLVPQMLKLRHTWPMLVFILAAVVEAPLVEETFYRGILFRAMAARLPFWSAALLSGFLFATAHGQLIVILPFTLLGAAFAYLTYHTGSLRASAFAHAAFNSLSTITVLLLSWALGGSM